MMKRGKAEEEWTEGVTARHLRIKEEAALQGNAGFKRVWAEHMTETARLMSLQKANAHFFLLNCVPGLQGLYAKQLSAYWCFCCIIDNMNVFMTSTSGSVPSRDSWEMRANRFLFPLALSLVSNKALKNVSRLAYITLLLPAANCLWCLLRRCGAVSAEENEKSEYNFTPNK